MLTRSAMIPNGVRVESNPRIGEFRERIAPNAMLHWDFSGATLEGVADVMAEKLGLPVLNETGLTGRYRMTLEISMEGLPQAGPIRDNAGLEKSLVVSSEALQDRMDTALRKVGLKLVRKQEAIEFLIVDHVERNPDAT